MNILPQGSSSPTGLAQGFTGLLSPLSAQRPSGALQSLSGVGSGQSPMPPPTQPDSALQPAQFPSGSGSDTQKSQQTKIQPVSVPGIQQPNTSAYPLSAPITNSISSPKPIAAPITTSSYSPALPSTNVTASPSTIYQGVTGLTSPTYAPETRSTLPTSPISTLVGSPYTAQKTSTSTAPTFQQAPTIVYQPQPTQSSTTSPPQTIIPQSQPSTLQAPQKTIQTAQPAQTTATPTTYQPQTTPTQPSYQFQQSTPSYQPSTTQQTTYQSPTPQPTTYQMQIAPTYQPTTQPSTQPPTYQPPTTQQQSYLPQTTYPTYQPQFSMPFGPSSAAMSKEISQAKCQECPPCQPMHIPQDIKVEFIPYQRTVVEYEQQEVVQRVPREEVVYQRQRRLVKRPVERIVTEYIKIERKIDYEVEYTTQQVQDAVEYEYVPIEKKIVSYPEDLAKDVASSRETKEVARPQSTNLTVKKSSTSKIIFNELNSTVRLNLRNNFSEKGIQALKVGKELGSEVVQRRSAKSEWRFVKSGQGFKIVQEGSGLALDFDNYEASEPVKLAAVSAERTTQNFQYEGVGGTGSGILRCQDDHNLCLGLEESEKGEEVKVVLNKIMRGRNPSQLWQFSPI